MDRRIITILLLIALSAGSTFYGIYLILTFQFAVTGSVKSFSMSTLVVKQRPYFLAPIAIGILGWLTTIYEVITLRKRDFVGSLREKMSREGFDREVFRTFSGRGGARRLEIMRSLKTPRLRNEIAKLINSDWKEVDRNVKILESMDLVKVQFSHGPMAVYHLTEGGKELLDIMQSQRDNSPKDPGTVHS